MARRRTPSSIATPIRSELDFDRDGTQISELHLPHSSHEDAWGVIAIPVAVIRNGSGPTALLMGGVHGDEYEGPIALAELVRELDAKAVEGRLIVLPALNPPALAAGRRTSPVDGLDLARSFPGDPSGTPTQQISHYVSTVLMPMADVVLDLHAGGTSLDIMTAAMVRRHPDPEITAQAEAAARAFGAPLAIVATGHREHRTAVATALLQDKVAFAVELGGRGAVTPEALDVARIGIRNLLVHLDLLAADVASPPYDGPLWEIADARSYVYATADGVFEPIRGLGEEIRQGQPAGLVHHLEEPGRPPSAVKFRRSGLLFCRRARARVVRGNCVAVVASPATP